MNAPHFPTRKGFFVAVHASAVTFAGDLMYYGPRKVKPADGTPMSRVKPTKGWWPAPIAATEAESLALLTPETTELPNETVTNFRPAVAQDFTAAEFAAQPVEVQHARLFAAHSRAVIAPALRTNVPDIRRLRPHTVYTGALQSRFYVHAVAEDGLVGLVSSVRDDEPVPYERGPRPLTVSNWFELVETAQERFDLPRVTGENPLLGDTLRSLQLESLIFELKNGLNDSPKYQRDYAWSQTDKELFIEAALAGRDLGRWVIVESVDKNLTRFVLDGKQRLNALTDFFASRFSVKGRFWHDLNWRDRNFVLKRGIQVNLLDAARVTRKNLLKIFLELNTGGVPQTAEHVARVAEMLKQEQALEELSAFQAEVTVGEMYDMDPEIGTILERLIPGYVAQNHLELTIGQILERETKRLSAD